MGIGIIFCSDCAEHSNEPMQGIYSVSIGFQNKYCLISIAQKVAENYPYPHVPAQFPGTKFEENNSEKHNNEEYSSEKHNNEEHCIAMKNVMI